MGSYENIVKIEEMRKRMEEGNIQAALVILDTMEIRKIKNMSDLSLIAEVYAVNERYEEAAKLYLKIYEKTKARKSLYQIIDLSIKNNNVEEAQHYLNEYRKLAPKDFYKYIFQYKIDKLKSEPYEVLIGTLQTLKQTEYMEKWAYELAKTYYKAGMEKECIRECSDIILWFGEGVYVEKAKILRSYFSGETDKEKIMEDLKRRAMEDTTRTTVISESVLEQAENEAVQVEEENTIEYEEDVCQQADFTLTEEAVDFEDDLKKDIQNIMTEGWKEDESEEDPAAQVIEVPAIEAWSEEPSAETGVNGSLPVQTNSDREIAEQEVERALYDLLEEEEMDEDDKKLSMIADKYDFLPEELFGNFLHVKGVKKQLVKSLESILDEHTKTVQIIITGTTGSGKTTLAKDITMFLNKAGKLKSSKIAKIRAEKLNGLDLISKKEALKDCCLIVEDASELKRQTIDNILELCNGLKGNIAVIFEENKKNMNKLFRECPKLMDLFKNRIHLPQYTQEDLVGFAYACLRQQDYRLNSNAESILQDKITRMMKQTEPQMYLEQIYHLMLGAMNAADLRMGKHLSELASQGKLRDVDVLTVLQEDFNQTLN